MVSMFLDIIGKTKRRLVKVEFERELKSSLAKKDVYDNIRKRNIVCAEISEMIFHATEFQDPLLQ